MTAKPSRPPDTDGIELVQAFVVDNVDIERDTLAETEAQIREEIRLNSEEPGEEAPVPDLVIVHTEKFATMLELRHGVIDIKYETLETSYNIMEEYFTNPKGSLEVAAIE